MKYIIEFEDEPYMREDGVNYYTCKSARWYKLGETIINRLTPYTEPDRKAIEDEVWKFTRELLNYTDDDWESITNMLILDIPYHEAKAKYDAWKKRKDEIHVGDEVKYRGDNCVVVYVGADEVYHVSDRHWLRCVVQGRQFLTKTGRHFDEVEKLLERMKAE